MRIGQLIAKWRGDRGVGVRAVAKEIGISSATLNRVECGENCDAKSLVKILVWALAGSGKSS